MVSIYFVAILVLATVAFVAGRRRGLSFAGGANRAHSLPLYHGLYTATAVVIPMFALLIAWGIVAPRVTDDMALSALPATLAPTDDLARDARLRDIVAIANGQAPA